MKIKKLNGKWCVNGRTFFNMKESEKDYLNNVLLRFKRIYNKKDENV